MTVFGSAQTFWEKVVYNIRIYGATMKLCTYLEFQKLDNRLDLIEATLAALAVAVSKLVSTGVQDAQAEQVAQDLNSAAAQLKGSIPAASAGPKAP